MIFTENRFSLKTKTMNKLKAIAVAVLVCGLGACEKKEPVAAKPVEKQAETPGPKRVVVPADSPKLQQIRVAAVEEREVAVDQVVAPGKIDVNPTRVSKVTLPVTGKIVSTAVRIGDTVQQGQVLLLLESSEADLATAAALQADASLIQVKAALIKAQSDYDRAKDLYAGMAVAKKDVLAAEAALAQAKAAVDQADAAKSQATARLDLLGLKEHVFRQRIEVRAPISGKVLDMTAIPGEYRNDASAPVMTIADLTSVWVVSEVPESSIRMIEKGERLEVELTAWPDKTFPAKVTRIADAVDPTTRTVKVYAELANPKEQLRPEMYGRIRHIDSSRKMPAIPPGAVVQDEKQMVVYREVTAGTFEPVAVTLGNQAGALVGVLSGLKPGDRIVVDGAMLLKSF